VLRQRLEAVLTGKELWRDKRSDDALVVTKIELEGWAVSNVRKGTTKNAWEVVAKCHFFGERGGAQLKVCVATPELDYEFFDATSGLASVPPEKLLVTSESGENLVRTKVMPARISPQCFFGSKVHSSHRVHLLANTTLSYRAWLDR
jgi:hypothetical protein